LVIKIENKEKAEKINRLARRFPNIVGVYLSDFGFLKEIKIYYVGREDKGFEKEVRESLREEILPDFKISLYFIAPRPALFEMYCN
jgi:hypothetical protein